MSLTIRELSVRYGPVTALAGVSLDLRPGEMFFLLGPSGCGKSTLLRAVAGFLEQHEGQILFDGQPLRGVPPDRRDFGMVFQNYALFPHLTVEKNVSFGLEARKVPADEARPRVAEALALVGLQGFETRRPGELSGGQQQRVAVARALVIRPKLLLLDEPLSNLDAKLRWEMRAEIRRIHRQTKLTTLYVTHDQKEALSLADRLAILKDGRLEAVGTPRELYWNPPTRFVAGFLGDVNTLAGTVAAVPGPERPGGVRTAWGEVPIPAEAHWFQGLNAGAAATVFCRPESLRLTSDRSDPSDRSDASDRSDPSDTSDASDRSDPSDRSDASDTRGPARVPAPGWVKLHAQARVTSSAFLGETTLYELELPGGLRWHALCREANVAGWPDGAAVRLAVPRDAWRLLPD